MLDVDEARRMLAYNHAVFDRFVRRLRRLGWDVVRENREVGHLSVFQTMEHILNVHDAWLNYIVPGRVAQLDDGSVKRHDFESWAELVAYERRVWAGVEVLAAQLTPQRLRQRVRAPWMAGQYTLSDAVHQVTIEQAHHLGEVIALLWQRDVEPPPMTWIQNLPRSPNRRR
jgi:uncharacterized damage-inducible protein DinB